MYADHHFFVLQDREVRRQELSERMAERRRQALARSRGPSLRAQMARRLFALAVAADRKETWNLVWESLEAKGGL